MKYDSWAPLWSGIVMSSLWDEDDFTIKVFLTMLAVKDADHICRVTPYELWKLTKAYNGKEKTQEQVLEALKVLSSPDTKRRDHQEFQGRRIKAVEDGWLVLNGEKYRQKVSDEMKKARNRRAQAAHRERAKIGKSKLLPGEGANERAIRNGATREQSEDNAHRSLPESFQEQPAPYHI